MAYRRAVTIDNTGNASTLTDYQVKVTLTSANMTFAHAESDGSDLGFVDSDVSTALYHWIESYDSGAETAVIWVKVPSIAGSSNHTIYMEYGVLPENPSSIADVFEFGDDFPGSSLDTTTNWTSTPGAGSITVTGGEVVIDNSTTVLPPTANSLIHSKTYRPAQNVIIEARWRITTVYGGGFEQAQLINLNDTPTDFPGSTSKNQFMFATKEAGDPVRHQSKNAGTWGSEDTVYATAFPTTDTQYRSRAVKLATGINWYHMSDAETVLGSLVGNTDAPVNFSDLAICFGGRGVAIKFAWIRVRQYTTPEPSQSVGAESEFSAPDDPTHRLTEEFIEVPYRTAPPENSARLTEEFIEVPYRDPLVAGPVRLTEEFIEVAYRSPITALADGPRITQQSVEVLYLLPESTDVFDDCGHFTGLREYEIRVYDDPDPDTGKRKAFGPDGEDLNGIAREINFEIQVRGGYGAGSCEFDVPWDKVDLAGTERVDVYMLDEPAYRGYLRIAQKNLASPESARPQFYGMVALLDQWLVKRKYAYGCDTDAATIARDIAQDYVAVTGRFPNVSLEMSSPVGVLLKEYDGRGKSVAQAFNELADLAPNQVIWGARMDSSVPVPGDVLYFSPRPTDTAYVVAVGDNVETLIYPVDTHEIVNSLAPLTGGEVQQPNLAPNGSFEELMPASEDWGNLLIDHDFEAGNSGGEWQLLTGSGSDASLKQNGSAGAFGAGKSGEWWGELDTINEEIYQDVYVIPERRYEASVWVRLEDGTSNTGSLILEGYNSASVLVTTTSVGLTGLTTIYQRFAVDQDLASYPSVVRLRIRVVVNGGTASNDGILIDDLGVYEYCSVAQQYWEVARGGNATLTDLDWDHETVTPRTGAYCVKVDAASIATGSDYIDIYNRIVHAPSVDANERYTLMAWWHTNGAGTPGANALSLHAEKIKTDGSTGTVFSSDTALIGSPAASTWQLLTLPITTESDTAKLRIYLRVLTNEAIYLDDVMLVKGEVPEEVRLYGGYWPGDTYQRYIDVEDTTEYSTTQDFDDLLDADVADSIDDYGEHEQEVTNEKVTDRTTALAFAAGVFNAQALPKIQAQLRIFGARTLIAQEGKVRLVNMPDAPNALWPARASYTITPEAINCSVELGNQKPDLQLLLQLTAERARR